MARVERTTQLPAKPADVWAALADFGAISTWAPNVDHSCLLSEQAQGVGAVRRVQAGRSTLRETILTWEPERELSYSLTGLPPVVRAVTNTWQLTAVGDGTDVTLVSEITVGPRPPHRVAGRIIGRMLGTASDRMLEGLAAHVSVRSTS